MQTTDIGFKPLPSLPALKPGLVVKLVDELNESKEACYYRITHVFNDIGWLYYMEISTPEQVRYAKRPQSMRIKTLMDSLNSGKDNACGDVPLPHEFIKATNANKVKLSNTEIANNNFKWIESILEKFKDEKNLQSRYFEPVIVEYATTLELSPVTLRKLILRYWYFGQSVLALGPLARGPKARITISESISTKKRGRSPRIAKKLGNNKFIPNQEDIQDMQSSLESKLRKGYTTKVSAHLEYLRTYFSKRHPNIYKQYLAKEIPEPVTIRQFRYYTSDAAWLDPELAKKLIKSKRNYSPRIDPSSPASAI